jgi:multimeric flavodoxin WrbA
MQLRISCISDKGAKSSLSEDLWTKARALMAERGHTVQEIELNRDDTSACTGCLQCWTRQTGECVGRDAIGDLTRNKLDCDLVIYLTPAQFGTCNATIKNAVDRGELMFKNKKRAQILIGFGEDLVDEERSTFIDLVARHRGEADVVHPDRKEVISVHVTRSIDDNERICREIGGLL